MKQMSLGVTGFERKTKRMRKCQFLDFEHGCAGVSAPAIGHRAANGVEYAQKLLFECQKILSPETSTDYGRVSCGCADLPYFSQPETNMPHCSIQHSPDISPEGWVLLGIKIP